MLLGGGIEPRERDLQPRENRALLAQELIIGFRQDSRQHLAETCRNHAIAQGKTDVGEGMWLRQRACVAIGMDDIPAEKSRSCCWS